MKTKILGYEMPEVARDRITKGDSKTYLKQLIDGYCAACGLSVAKGYLEELGCFATADWTVDPTQWQHEALMFLLGVGNEGSKDYPYWESSSLLRGKAREVVVRIVLPLVMTGNVVVGGVDDDHYQSHLERARALLWFFSDRCHLSDNEKDQLLLGHFVMSTSLCYKMQREQRAEDLVRALVVAGVYQELVAEKKDIEIMCNDLWRGLPYELAESVDGDWFDGPSLNIQAVEKLSSLVLNHRDREPDGLYNVGRQVGVLKRLRVEYTE